MLKILIVFVVVSVILALAEYLWRIKHYPSELTRKLIHIGVGTFAAFWPYFLSWHQIELVAVIFFICISISRLLTILGSIHIIERRTIGEMLFAVSIGLTALLTHDRLIYMTAILTLSLADGIAALIGTKYGLKHRYFIGKHRKTIIGSLSFWLISLLIIAVYGVLAKNFNWQILLWLPITATFLENVGLSGTDNVLVPVLIVFALR